MLRPIKTIINTQEAKMTDAERQVEFLDGWDFKRTEIIMGIVEYGIPNIGQWTPEQIKILNNLVKDGSFKKHKSRWAGIGSIKTYYYCKLNKSTFELLI